MGHAEDYQQLLPALQAIPADRVRKPNMEVAAAAQEAGDLYEYAMHDRSLLERAGLPWELVESLPVRGGTLVHADSLWLNCRFSTNEAHGLWKKQLPRAKELRRRLTRGLRYALEGVAQAAARLSVVGKRRTNAQMIQDLNELAALGRDYPAKTAAAGLEAALFEEARELAVQLGDLLARSRERKEPNRVRDMRDRAFTYAMEAVNKVRKCGRYALADDPERVVYYASQCRRKQRQKARLRSGEAKGNADEISDTTGPDTPQYG
jgi:hypothetical protein